MESRVRAREALGALRAVARRVDALGHHAVEAPDLREDRRRQDVAAARLGRKVDGIAAERVREDRVVPRLVFLGLLVVWSVGWRPPKTRMAERKRRNKVESNFMLFL